MSKEFSVKLASDVLFQVGPVPVTDSVFTAVCLSVIFILGAILLRPHLAVIPGRIQTLLEMTLGHFLDTLTMAYGSEGRARKYLPYFLTIFLFLLVMNQMSLFPLVNDIQYGEGTLFHMSTADWSFTLALALITVLGAQVIALTLSPLRHIGNYFRFHAFLKVRTPMDLLFACIEVFLGLMDIIGDIAKIISLSARLFGNLFAGEVMVYVIVNKIFAYVVPMPIILLGILSGLVQAYVFAFLSMQFMAGTVEAARPPQKQVA